MEHVLAAAGIGLVAGTVGGAVGTAGGSVMVPGLLAAHIVSDYKTAVGTVLLSMVPPVSAGAAYAYWQEGNVSLRPAIALFITNLIGAWVSAKYLVKYVSNKTLEILYGIYLITMGLFFLLKKKHKSK